MGHRRAGRWHRAILLGGHPGCPHLEHRPPPGLTFNGSNAFVSLGDPDALDFIGPITIEAWVKPLATDGLRNIVARDSSTNPPGAVFLRIWDGKYQIGSWNGLDHLVAAPVPPEDLDKWVHLAGVYDGIQWSLYRNGEKVASSMDSIGAVPANVRWAIGAQSDGADRYFKGSIRDVRIWLIARTPEELRAGMGQPLSGQEDGLAGYWPMNEGQSTTLRDLAGRNTGSLRNGLW
ncbi:LamG domain-containing protein [Archangium lansingense]|uniref:LamG domain-containing protein n=1 Tax=Archangium lansingense TaxID=2995310 RepID=A0ABT4AFK0_9BACT|nr:LamG domain-containing protein [Archangium lansinium]MCY1080463.1 LamG domain-containing protein [Archangium lansinium]